MSGFEMHSFRSIDRSLTAEEMAEIDTWSSRFSPSPNGIDFIYHYGSFKKDAEVIFPKYFDVMLHVNNWGTRQVMFRFPKGAVNTEDLKAFRSEDVDELQIFYQEIDGFAVLNIIYQEEDGSGWIDEEDYSVDAFVLLRNEIMRGDYRSLMLAWLPIFQIGRQYFSKLETEKMLTPPVPAGLDELSTAHKHLVRTFLVNRYLIKAVAVKSGDKTEALINYQKLLTDLTSKEKDEFLLKIINGEPGLQAKLMRKLESFSEKSSTNGERFTWAELDKQFEITEKTEIEKEARIAYEKLSKRMAEVKKQEKVLWTQVSYGADAGGREGYDTAMAALDSLRELSVFEEKKSEFREKINSLREDFKHKQAFIKRLRQADY